MVRALPQQIKVESYAGYKADERPIRFVLKEHTYEIKEILDRWYGEDSDYFKVKADDGNVYILRHYMKDDKWVLEGYRKE